MNTPARQRPAGGLRCRFSSNSLRIPLSLAVEFFGFTLEFNLESDGRQERLEVGEQVILCDSQIKVKQEQQLSLHQIDLGQGESEAFKTLYRCVSRPVFVLWTRIIQVLCGKDQRSEEDAVDRTSHTLGDWW
jgi:hypothetical protein